MLKARQPGMLFIFITILIDVIGLGIIIPVLPDLIASLTHSTITEAATWGGWLIGVYAFMQFFFSPMMGALSDSYGRRPIILISLLGLGLDYILMAVAPNITILFVGRVLSGIMGASFTVATAYIADVSTPEKRAQNFGMLGAAFGLGFILGPVIGGLLGNLGERIPFYAAAILSLLNFTYGVFILPESHPVENRRSFEWKRVNPFTSIKRLGKYKGFMGLIVAFFFASLGSFAIQSTWSFFGKAQFNWDNADVGYSLGAVGVLISLVQGGLIRYTSKVWGLTKSIVIGMAFATVGLILFSFANAGWMMYLILIPYCIGGISTPSLQGYMSNQVPLNEQGEMQGSLASMVSITAFLGPLIMTQTYSYFAGDNAVVRFPGAAFMLGALFTLLALILTLRTLKKNI
jgi:DHA1 family tetracycline resistance protein-like MFS transporter